MNNENGRSNVDKLEFILSVAGKIREERGIKTTSNSRLEGSCIGANGGEIANMFWAQLLYTSDGLGEWKSLRDSEILTNLYDYVSSLDI